MIHLTQYIAIDQGPLVDSPKGASICLAKTTRKPVGLDLLDVVQNALLSGVVLLRVLLALVVTKRKPVGFYLVA